MLLPLSDHSVVDLSKALVVALARERVLGEKQKNDLYLLLGKELRCSAVRKSLMAGRIDSIRRGRVEISVLDFSPQMLRVDIGFALSRGEILEIPKGSSYAIGSCGRQPQVTMKGDFVWDYEHPDSSLLRARNLLNEAQRLARCVQALHE